MINLEFLLHNIFPLAEPSQWIPAISQNSRKKKICSQLWRELSYFFLKLRYLNLELAAIDLRLAQFLEIDASKSFLSN
jgi:hypothetical protein